MSFKVGDKVRYIHHSTLEDRSFFVLDKFYTITKIGYKNPINPEYYLDYLDCFAWEYQIKPLIKETRLSRRLYPNAEVRDGWILI